MLERLIIAVAAPSDSDGPPTARDPVLAAAEHRALSVEFPEIHVESFPQAPSPDELCYTIDAIDWQGEGFDLRAADARMAELSARGRVSLRVIGPPAGAALVGHQALTRYQRFIDRRNRASRSTLFDQVLCLHRTLHDLDKPLVRADYDHALDTWQWMLRLDPGAGLGAQVAALFHDVERLVSEADARIEHQAESYQAFKDAHARRGATLARAQLASTGLEPAVLDQIDYLIQRHERPFRDPETALLNDADALSFFSLNSAGYLSYFGPEQTRRKVVYTSGRLRPEARARLRKIRYCPEVRALVMAELGASAGAAMEGA